MHRRGHPATQPRPGRLRRLRRRLRRLCGGYGAYGGGYGNARVLGISRVEPSSGGGLTIRGVASSGFNAGYGGYGNEGTPDLTFRCRTDYRGFVVDVDVDRAQRNYGNSYQQPYDNPYSVYGYRRY